MKLKVINNQVVAVPQDDHDLQTLVSLCTRVEKEVKKRRKVRANKGVPMRRWTTEERDFIVQSIGNKSGHERVGIVHQLAERLNTTKAAVLYQFYQRQREMRKVN